MRVAVSTVVTADHFQNYLPLFLYSLHKACPDYVPIVFLRGQLNELNAEALELVPGKRVIHEDMFLDYPFHLSTTNSLRFIMDERYFSKFNSVFFTDVDMVFLSHEPSFGTYYQQKMDAWGDDYWSRRGPKRAKSNEAITHRVAGGCLYVRVPEWFVRTGPMRIQMEKKVRRGEIGKVREDDELMLWDICAGSGMKCPTVKKNKRRKKYREVHLGDFKFEHRWTNNSKMRKRITIGNMLKWFRLKEDETWQRLCKVCSSDPEIKMVLANADAYFKARRKTYNENLLDSSDVQTGQDEED